MGNFLFFYLSFLVYLCRWSRFMDRVYLFELSRAHFMFNVAFFIFILFVSHFLWSAVSVGLFVLLFLFARCIRQLFEYVAKHPRLETEKKAIHNNVTKTTIAFIVMGNGD